MSSISCIDNTFLLKKTILLFLFQVFNDIEDRSIIFNESYYSGNGDVVISTNTSKVLVSIRMFVLNGTSGLVLRYYSEGEYAILPIYKSVIGCRCKCLRCCKPDIFYEFFCTSNESWACWLMFLHEYFNGSRHVWNDISHFP